jgi:hypothetical protein
MATDRYRGSTDSYSVFPLVTVRDRLRSPPPLLEAVVGPRMWLLTALGFPVPATWLKNPILLIAVLVLALPRGLPLSQIGLRPWGGWSAAEKSYFVQTIVLANGIFFAMTAGRLRQVFDDPALRNRFWVRHVPATRAIGSQ